MRRWLGLGSAAAAGCVALVLGALIAPATAAQSASQHPVLIVSAGGHSGPFQYVTVDGHVTASRLLPGKHVFDFAVSPDGERVAYEHGAGGGLSSVIYLVPTAGGSGKLVAPGSQPAWSPDGSQLAVTADEWDLSSYEHHKVSSPADPQIYVLAPGDTPHRFVDDPHHWDDEPSWSPDGKEIAFARSTSSGGDGPHEGLYISNGTSMHQLIGDASHGQSVFEPVWSPNGQSIAFARFDPNGHRIGLADIWTIDADGTHLHRVTNDPEFEDDNPQWSPYGSQLSFTVTKGFDQTRSAVGIATIGHPGRCLVDAQWHFISNAQWLPTAAGGLHSANCESFLRPPPPTVLGCSYRAARSAVERSTLSLLDQRDAYRIRGHITRQCFDITGDRRRDLITRFYNGHSSSSYDWAAFRRGKRNWHLIGHGDGYKITTADHHGKLVVSKGDCTYAGACPTAPRLHLTYQWNGKRLVVVRRRKS